MSEPKRELARIFFFVFIVLSFVGALFLFPRLSIPLVVAYIFALVFGPMIHPVMKLGLSRNTSVIIVFFAAIFFTVYPFVKVVPLVTSEVQNIEYYIPKVETYIKKEYEKGRRFVEAKTGYQIETDAFSKLMDHARSESTNFLLKLPQSIASFIEWLFVVPLFFFFMLKDGKSLKKLVLKVTPNSIFERFYWLSHQFNRQLGDYIFAKFVEASIVGIIITAGLLILNVRFAFIFGLIAAITNVIPYLGPVLGMVPALIFALVEYGLGTNFGALAILFLVANAIDIAVVFPLLVSKIVDLHPILVVISVILGSQAMGVAGMIISIPLAAASKLIFSEIYNEIYRPK